MCLTIAVCVLFHHRVGERNLVDNIRTATKPSILWWILIISFGFGTALLIGFVLASFTLLPILIALSVRGEYTESIMGTMVGVGGVEVAVIVSGRFEARVRCLELEEKLKMLNSA
jgi:hypothetical protein